MGFGDYVDIFSALLTPLIAIIMVYIAYQQWITNRLKFRHELYESRLRTFHETIQLMSIIIQLGYARREQIIDFRLKVIENSFLFGNDIKDYLNEVYEKARKLRRTNEQLTTFHKRRNQKEEDYEKFSKEDEILFQWFVKQPEEAKEKFKKYLDLSTK